MNFDTLFSPIEIRNLRLKNRIVMPAMGTNYATSEGFVTGRLVNHYATRARGGAGLVIVETGGVDHPAGKALRNHLALCDDRFLPGLQQLVSAVHQHHAKICFQLNHAGNRAIRANTGTQPVAPSPIPIKPRPPDWPGNETPRQLTAREIGEIAARFAQAGGRVKRAGADALEIHGASGYLVNEFLSPYSNHRTDAYGGSLENRTRFASEIVTAIREEVGAEFPIIFRINADEYVEGGLNLGQARPIAQILEKAGIDAFNVSVGNYDTLHMAVGTSAFPPGYLVHLAQGIKEVVRVPVIAVGRINTPELAEKILEEGKADLVAMGRALWADPELPNKAREGRLSEIRHCMGCLQGCFGRLRQIDAAGLGMATCSVNPMVGNEAPMEKAATQKMVAVIGGGPAGMETARVAALRGHRVALYEREDKLGGQLALASIPPFKSEIKHVVEYYEAAFSRLGVHVKLRTAATLENVSQSKPDVVILATGGTPLVPDIPGAGGENVVTAWEVLERKRLAGNPVVVVGGGMVGCETAEFLATEGKTVTVVEMLDDIGSDMAAMPKYVLRQRLIRLGVRMLTKTKIAAIDSGGVVSEEGEKIPAGTVVLAAGVKPELSLVADLRGKRWTFHWVGDCAQPGNLLGAIHGGFKLGRDI